MCLWSINELWEKENCQEKKRRQTLDDDDDFQEDGDSHNVESSTTFNFAAEHPSHKIMAVTKRKKEIIPMINVSKLLPNIKDLNIAETNPTTEVTRQREQYAKIALLLFYPFRNQDDLISHGSLWSTYQHIVHSNRLWSEDIFTKSPRCIV